MNLEIISWSIPTKVWDRAGIELPTPGSAVRLASVARHVIDCPTRLGKGEMSLHDHSEDWPTKIPLKKTCFLTASSVLLR